MGSAQGTGSVPVVVSSWGLVEDALRWLQAHYTDQRFYVERDIVWTLQRWLGTEARRRGLPVSIYNDYPTEPGPRRALSADLALVAEGPVPEVVMELKYEPSHRRTDITAGKFPVVGGWSAVVSDASRVTTWVADGRARSGAAVFIDEGGWLAAKTSDSGQWDHWGGYGTDDLDVHIHRIALPPAVDIEFGPSTGVIA